MLIVTNDFWLYVGAANATREIVRGLVKLGVELITTIHDDSLIITSDELKPSIAPKAIHGGHT
jgi:hypothetical protein